MSYWDSQAIGLLLPRGLLFLEPTNPQSYGHLPGGSVSFDRQEPTPDSKLEGPTLTALGSHKQEAAGCRGAAGHGAAGNSRATPAVTPHVLYMWTWVLMITESGWQEEQRPGLQFPIPLLMAQAGIQICWPQGS